MRVICFLVAWMAFGGSASAFHEIESFNRSEQGGGNGSFFTGSSRFKGYDCRICHTKSEGRISIGIQVNRPELLQGNYETNKGYAITLSLQGEHRGLDSAFNPNTFMLEFVDAEGNLAGEYISGPAPTTLVDERRIVAAEGFGEGETQWSFTWFSPRETVGAITLHIAMVDGDGAGEEELRWIDPLSDDVATMTLRLCPTGEAPCPVPLSPVAEKSTVHCSLAGGDATGMSALLWVCIACVFRKRILVPLLALIAVASCSPQRQSQVAAPAVPQRTELLYQVEASPASEALLEQTRTVLQERLKALQLPHAQVERDGQRFLVSLATRNSAILRRVRSILVRPLDLDIFASVHKSEFMQSLCDSLAGDSRAGVMKIESALDVWQNAQGQIIKDCYISALDRTAMLTFQEARVEGCQTHPDAERSPCIVSGKTILQRYLSSREGLVIPTGYALLFEQGETSAFNGEVAQVYWRSHYVSTQSILSGDMVQQWHSEDSEYGPLLKIVLNESGRAQLQSMTEANIGAKLAIVVDGVVQPPPLVESVIESGQLSFHPGSLDFEAADFAATAQAGALPVRLVVAQPVR